MGQPGVGDTVGVEGGDSQGLLGGCRGRGKVWGTQRGHGMGGCRGLGITVGRGIGAGVLGWGLWDSGRLGLCLQTCAHKGCSFPGHLSPGLLGGGCWTPTRPQILFPSGSFAPGGGKWEYPEEGLASQACEDLSRKVHREEP